MIRGVKVINGKREEAVEEVLKSIGAEVKIVEMKRLGVRERGKREGNDMSQASK